MVSIWVKVIGYSAALGSAFFWALGTILFRKLGEKISPLGMNLAKSFLGTLYLGIIFIFIRFSPINFNDFLLLGFSGLLGIALGDTFFFKALIYLGPKLAIILGCLGPVLTLILSVLILAEGLSLLRCAGILLTLFGVWIVLLQDILRDYPKSTLIKNWKKGIWFSILSSLSMAGAIIMAKMGLSKTHTLEATFIRLLWSAGGLFIWGFFQGKLKIWFQPLKEPSYLGFMLLTVVVIIFGGFWLFLVGIKFIPAGVATILNSTTPIFILPLAWAFFKENISFTSVIGTFIAVGGIAIIFST